MSRAGQQLASVLVKAHNSVNIDVFSPALKGLHLLRTSLRQHKHFSSWDHGPGREDIQTVMDSFSAVKLREELEAQGEQRSTMPYPELLTLIKQRCSGVAEQSKPRPPGMATDKASRIFNTLQCCMLCAAGLPARTMVLQT